MRYTKKDLQKAVEHIACYLIKDLDIRTSKVNPYLDKEGKIKPGRNELESTFREVLLDDYNSIAQTYSVALQPLFKYLEKELPQVAGQLTAFKALYDIVLKNGNFADGCKCIGCKKER